MEHHPTERPAPVDRRRALKVIGGVGLAGLLAACSGGSEDAADPTTTTARTTTTGDVSSTDTVFTAADFAGLGACRVLPEWMEGPFPTITPMERRDLTEGMTGMPLRVGVQVVDEACEPIPDAVVEIWHCDVDGDYSAYADGYTDDDAGDGTTFYRGHQVANGEGIVEFVTNYPGWYGGRAVHIHAKVHLDDTTVLTTQFLFDDALNEEVLATGPYAAFGPPDTTNAADAVTGGTGVEDGIVLTVSEDAELSGYRGLIVVGVDPGATSKGTP